MDEIEQLLANNRRFAADEPPPGLGPSPSRQLVVLTCMDCRIDVLALLGAEAGQVHVLRNAGGIVTDDAIRSVAISQRRLGTRAVMVIQHTGCGMQSITDEEFTAELARDAGTPPPFAIGSFTDLETSVRQGVLSLRESPFMVHTDAIRGFVYDVESRRLREVPVP